ncbi:MAG TPA: cation transporter [Euryarchaeota archaeon]|nr:cation transporter [Euryarchaeota archaeon]
MKAVLKLEGLDCANCAAKIENEVQRIPGVEEATVTFMTQKMTIVAPDDKIEAIVEEATKLTKKLEGDVVVKRIK